MNYAKKVKSNKEMEKRESKILNQIIQDMNNKEYEEAVKELITTMPNIVKIHKEMHKNMKLEGYTDKQSFQFATEYTLRLFKL